MSNKTRYVIIEGKGTKHPLWYQYLARGAVYMEKRFKAKLFETREAAQAVIDEHELRAEIDEATPFKFRWEHRGKTPDGGRFIPRGTGYALDSDEAFKNIDSMLRSEYPEVKWMNGRDVEEPGIKYGPTITFPNVKVS